MMNQGIATLIIRLFLSIKDVYHVYVLYCDGLYMTFLWTTELLRIREIMGFVASVCLSI